MNSIFAHDEYTELQFFCNKKENHCYSLIISENRIFENLEICTCNKPERCNGNFLICKNYFVIYNFAIIDKKRGFKNLLFRIYNCYKFFKRELHFSCNDYIDLKNFSKEKYKKSIMML